MLIASADGFQPQASTIVVNDEPVAYDILLSGTSGLTGRVRAVETGCRSTDAMVDRHRRARRPAGHRQATGEKGEFAFTELVPGTVTVAVNAAGYRPRALPLEVGGTGVTRVEVAPPGRGRWSRASCGRRTVRWPTPASPWWTRRATWSRTATTGVGRGVRLHRPGRR